jgi:hypothetical protein
MLLGLEKFPKRVIINMQCINLETMAMSFDFGSNNINQFKAQAAYKDGGGMGGGGMYMRQNNKRKDQPEDDMFEFSGDSSGDEVSLDSKLEEKDIPKDTLFNKFVNWFRQ